MLLPGGLETLREDEECDEGGLECEESEEGVQEVCEDVVEEEEGSEGTQCYQATPGVEKAREEVQEGSGEGDVGSSPLQQQVPESPQPLGGLQQLLAVCSQEVRSVMSVSGLCVGGGGCCDSQLAACMPHSGSFADVHISHTCCICCVQSPQHAHACIIPTMDGLVSE